MPQLIVKDRAGQIHNIEFDSTFTLMEVLRDNGFDIEASCGGCCACATCHVYGKNNWLDKIKIKDDEEDSMLDQTFNVQKNSRLSCQIELTNELNGLEIEIAPE